MSKTIKRVLVILIILIILAFLLLKVWKVQDVILRKVYPKAYQTYVELYAQEYDIDPLMIYSIIKAESNFNVKAKSKSGAIGLMQLMEKTAEEIATKLGKPLESKEDLLEPERNIQIGTCYFAELMNRYNDNMLLSLTAYNAGIGNVEQWIKDGIIRSDGSDIENIPYQETNHYVRKILQNYKMYDELY